MSSNITPPKISFEKQLERSKQLEKVGVNENILDLILEEIELVHSSNDHTKINSFTDFY